MTKTILRGIYFVIAFSLLLFVLLSISRVETTVAQSCSNPSQLDWYTLSKVNENKDFYEEVSDETNVPWELLAAIHYRETGFSHTNPHNGQGIFQFVSGAGGPYPYGAVSDKEFVRQLTFMAERIQDDYVWRSNLPYTKRQLKATNEDAFRIKDVLFSYNGRASVYANQAASYGFNSSSEPYEGSPYVMNRFDCKRQNMGLITRDYGSIDGIDTRYGAYTLYAELVGDGVNSNSYDIVDLSDFDAGNLISDVVFTNNNSMSADDINDFLEELVPVCDTNGELFYNGKPRAEVDSNNPPPYTCLTNYVNSETGQNAGQVIKEAADEHQINPQVLLVLMQVGQGLTDDDWPWTNQYQKAMCANASISECWSISGFRNQVNFAAEKLRSFYDSSNDTYEVGTHTIPYNSGSSCSGDPLQIKTKATAALYNYTPFQPNQAQIDNPYGYGDSCSIDNNLDFYTYFNNWFEQNIIFIEMTKPRYLTLKKDVRKIDPHDFSAAGPTLLKGRIIPFDSKININGELYLRTNHDNLNNLPYIIKFKDLHDYIEYEKMVFPRKLRADKRLLASTLVSSTKSSSNAIIYSGTDLSFDSKIFLNEVLHLLNSKSGLILPYRDLSEIEVDFIPMTTPRWMSPKKDTSTQHPTLLSNSNDSIELTTDNIYYFTDKIWVDGEWNLRTSEDSLLNKNVSVKISDLENKSLDILTLAQPLQLQAGSSELNYINIRSNTKGSKTMEPYSAEYFDTQLTFNNRTYVKNSSQLNEEYIDIELLGEVPTMQPMSIPRNLIVSNDKVGVVRIRKGGQPELTKLEYSRGESIKFSKKTIYNNILYLMPEQFEADSTPLFIAYTDLNDTLLLEVAAEE